MDLTEAIELRHSVRSYESRPLAGEVVDALSAKIEKANAEGGLHIRLATERKHALGGFFAHYGILKNVRNYLALWGKGAEDLDERAGYYGERLVLEAQRLGLNTCWVAGTYDRRRFLKEAENGEQLVCVIALGYGSTQGAPHKGKPLEKLYRIEGEGAAPQWFLAGVAAAEKAPTAMHRQDFCFTLDHDGRVRAQAGTGKYAKIDLGIVKCHFEIGAGEPFEWAEN